LLRYGDNTFIATLRGRQAKGAEGESADSLLAWGTYTLRQDDEDFAVIGSAVQGYLGVNLEEGFEKIVVYSPRKGGGNSFNPADEFTVRDIRAIGVLKPHQQLDDYFVTPLSFAREVIGEYEMISAVEIDLADDVSIATFQKDLSRQLGRGFIVKDRGQQNPTL